MPYYISNDNPDCSGWAVEKADGEVIGCHTTRADAIEQMVAVSAAEGIEPGGERSAKALPDLTPPQGAREEADRGLAWRREHGRGGTPVGIARARDISNGRELSPETIGRMVSYFARHEVDKEAEGWSPGEDGYPSNGRIAWALWGGDPGRTWANAMLRRIRAEEDSASVAPAGKAGTGSGEMNVKRIDTRATFAVKAATGDAPGGNVEALVSVFNNTDLVGDRVMPGAFEKSLARYTEAGKSIPFVWSHQWDDPNAYIGKVVKAEETADGLMVHAALFDTPTAQHIKTLLAEGVVTEFSFAYDVIDAAPGKDGVNELRELHILEAGPTLKGANPATQLIGVRAFEAAMRQQQAKAEPGELEPGSFVRLEDGTYGRVEYVMTEGTFGIDGDAMSLEASAEDPLALVRIYEEDGEETYTPTEFFVGRRFSELTADEEKAAPKSAAPRAAKAGRVLSTKNEDRIRQAQGLLGEVLSTLEEGAKSAEPDSDEIAAAAATGTDADAILALLELEDLDA